MDSVVKVFYILADLLFALSITKRGVSKSVTVTVDLPICPSISDSFCFVYFEALWFCAYTFRITVFLVN